MIEDVLSGQSKYHIEQGDVLTVLASWPAECVQTVVTSPPYWNLRDYSVEGQIGLEATIEEYVEKMVQVFRAVRRVLRKDGTCWANFGDSYAGGAGGRGDIGNLIGGVSTRTQDVGKGRIKKDVPAGLKPKDLCMIPARVALALQADGWWLRSVIIWSKPNPMPESVTDRPTTSHEYIYLLSRSADYYYDASAVMEPAEYGRRDWSSVSGNLAGVGINGSRGHATVSGGDPSTGRNKRTVWTVPSQAFSAAHFATFPPKLIEPCILAGSRPGDVVLDPFVGAGTTALVALRHNRRALGAELNQEYIDMARKRIAGDERANQTHMELTA